MDAGGGFRDAPGESPSPAARAREERRRWLVPVARRTVSLQWLPLILAATVVYAAIAASVPFNSQSYTGVFFQSILFLLTTSFILMSPNGDRLDAFRAVSVFFLLAFCIGDLFNERRLVFYYVHEYSDLLTRATALALVCYVLMIAGYHIPVFRRLPERLPARHHRVDPARVVPLALAFYFTGLVFYLIFFTFAGGADVILAGEGGVARAHFSRGIGILFWPAMWMTSGGVMYYAARAMQLERHRWRAVWPLVLEFALLTLLQGRHRALGPLLMALVVTHYLVRPLRLPRLVIYALAAVVFAMTVSLVRSPSMRSDFYASPALAVQSVFGNFGHNFAEIMRGDIGCVWKTMLIIDKVPRVRPYAMGNTLLIPFNPFFRLLGLHHLQGRPLGNEGYMLSRPELNLDPRTTTGFLPSVVGEFRWNFPWPVCLFFYFGYGLLLRAIYQKLIVERGDFAAVGIYAVLGLYVVEHSFQSPTQNIFEMSDVVVPMVLIRMMALRSRQAVAQIEADQAPVSPAGSGEMHPGAMGRTQTSR